MKFITGGLKLKNIENYPPGSGFKPIMDMIDSEGSNLSLLTYSSLYGFMITLDVTKENSNYFGLNSNFNRFNQPVTSFILKLAVITERSTKLPDYMGVSKASETQYRFLSEAKLQQSIWEKTIVGGREGVCPSVVNLAFFNNYESKSLLQELMNNILKDGSGHNKHDLIELINYLNRIILLYPTYEIGILVMPNIQNSVTFHKFLDINKNNDNVMKEVIIKIITKILRLYVDAKVIHMDLHINNILVYSTDTGEIRVMLIDFGRASSIADEKEDRYLNVIDKTILNNQATNLFDSIFNTNFNDTFNINVTFLLEKYYNKWVRNYEIFKYMVFKLLKDEISVTKASITNTTIHKYKSKGWLIDFEHEVRYPDIYPSSIVEKIVVPEYKEDDYESTVVDEVTLADELSSKTNKTKRLFSMQDEDDNPRNKKRQSTLYEETIIDQNGGNPTRIKKLIRSSKNKRFKSKRIINAKKRKWTLKRKRN